MSRFYSSSSHRYISSIAFLLYNTSARFSRAGRFDNHLNQGPRSASLPMLLPITSEASGARETLRDFVRSLAFPYVLIAGIKCNLDQLR